MILTPHLTILFICLNDHIVISPPFLVPQLHTCPFLSSLILISFPLSSPANRQNNAEVSFRCFYVLCKTAAQPDSEHCGSVWICSCVQQQIWIWTFLPWPISNLNITVAGILYIKEPNLSNTTAYAHHTGEETALDCPCSLISSSA